MKTLEESSSEANVIHKDLSPGPPRATRSIFRKKGGLSQEQLCLTPQPQSRSRRTGIYVPTTARHDRLDKRRFPTPPHSRLSSRMSFISISKRRPRLFALMATIACFSRKSLTINASCKSLPRDTAPWFRNNAAFFLSPSADTTFTANLSEPTFPYSAQTTSPPMNADSTSTAGTFFPPAANAPLHSPCEWTIALHSGRAA